MPSVCSEPGCPVLLDRPGKCDAHRRDYLRSKEARRSSPHERGYDGAWRRARAVYLRMRPTCERCGQPATTVHHRTLGPLDPGGNDPANLEALCERCHASDSGRRLKGWGRTK